MLKADWPWHHTLLQTLTVFPLTCRVFRSPVVAAGASAHDEPQFVQSREDLDANEQYAIAGYTPANYIVYSERPKDACTHRLSVEVQAPVAVCFELFHDWSRLVEFFDMIAQVRLLVWHGVS